MRVELKDAGVRKNCRVSIMKSVLATCFILLSSCSSGGVGKVPLGSPAPFASLTFLDGSPHTLQEFRGKHIVLAFWATWCTKSGPLIAELNEYAAKKASRSDIVFLAVSVDKSENVEKVKERIIYQKLDGFTHAFSGNAEYDDAFMAYGKSELPLIIVINPRGVVSAHGDDLEVVKHYFGEVN